MIQIFDGPACPPFPLAENLPSPDDMAATAEQADARICLTENGVLIAHAALWWRDTPVHEDQHLGAIGGFAARDEAAANQLLEAACVRLKEAGSALAVGPMNGNTWRRHRYVIESGNRGPFLLEPRNTGGNPAWWQSAGFGELSCYSSSVIALDGTSTLSPHLKDRLLRSGVRIRLLDPSRYDDELHAIHGVCLKSFAANFLYTPLDLEAFVASYRKVRDHVDPDFVRIAERDGKPCGFVFGIADLEAAKRGETPAIIVKTLAVDPDSRCAGLGSLLVEEIHQAAFAKGFREAIHALQHETNTSRKITGRHHCDLFRRYALYSKPL